MTTQQDYHKRERASTENITNVIMGWDKVLRDAEDGLREAESRVRKLKRAIRTVKSKIAAGESFPLASTQKLDHYPMPRDPSDRISDEEILAMEITLCHPAPS